VGPFRRILAQRSFDSLPTSVILDLQLERKQLIIKVLIAPSIVVELAKLHLAHDDHSQSGD